MASNPSTPFAAEWPEPEVLHRELEEWARMTAQAEPRALRIGYLEGHDHGGAVDDRHLDLILVMEEFELPPAERVGMWDLGPVPVPAQTLVYTLEEWSELLEAGISLSNRLREQMVWVYERAAAEE